MALLGRGSRQSRRRDPEAQMTVVEHLEDLRRALIISIVAWVVGTIVAYVFWHDEFQFLLHRAGLQQAIFLNVTGGFMFGLRLAFYVGILVAAPVILWQMWWFVSPGLLQHEKRIFFPLVFFSYLFFLGGVAAALFALPIFIKILTFPGFFAPIELRYLPDISQLFSFILLICLGFGLVFELPVVLYALGRMGIIDSRWLYRHRLYWVLALGLLANLMTPGADPITPLIMFIPLWVFWEGAALALRLSGR